MKEISEPRHAEPHLTESSTIRDFVFGFGDGINTSLGIAAGVGGAVKSRIAETGIVKGGLEMAGLGTGVALIGFGIGNELANLGIINI